MNKVLCSKEWPYVEKDEKKTEMYFDKRTGLWYHVRWDDKLQCFVWTIAPNQRLILDSTAK